MKCQALNREVNAKECAHAQTELPKKFCDGCDWFTEKTSEQINLKHAKSTYTPHTYIVRLSKKLRILLIKEAQKNNIQPREYIIKILAEKLSNLVS